jgi:hypothetical protein
MDVNFTLWSLKEVLKKIPFDSPVDGPVVDIDFSEIAAPHYVKHDFKAIIIYAEKLPYEASCSIYSPSRVVTVVIIIKRQYEEKLKAWLGGDRKALDLSCFRRELYCHEACHLVAIIRAFPSERSSMAREDFVAKIKGKFEKSIKSAEEIKNIPFVSVEKEGKSPSIFDKEHFRYSNDGLNYFNLYQELMLSYDKMVMAVKKLCENITGTGLITFDDVAGETLVARVFFDIFPEKLAALQKILVAEINRKHGG